MLFYLRRALPLLFLAGCAPAATQTAAPALAPDSLYTSFDTASGFTAYLTPEARVIATGALEMPAPRMRLGANCAGRGCVPTEARLWFVRTAPDLQLQDAYAPLLLNADGQVMRWDAPRYSARPAGVAGTAETVEVTLTLDQLRGLAAAQTVSGRVGLLRDFSVGNEGVKIFDMMLAVLGG